MIEMTGEFPNTQAQVCRERSATPCISINGTDSAVLGIVNSQDPVNPTPPSAKKTGETQKIQHDNLLWGSLTSFDGTSVRTDPGTVPKTTFLSYLTGLETENSPKEKHLLPEPLDSIPL
jgi:hypothetical protein